MNKKFFKAWALLVISLTSVSVLAQQPHVITVRTVKISGKTYGITSDLELVGFDCGFRSANLVFPGPTGEVNLATYNSSGRLVTNGRSPFKALTDKAFEVACSGELQVFQLDVGAREVELVGTPVSYSVKSSHGVHKAF